ncbi:flagellar FliJ family protein [Helicobacter sp.]|uniref:flagellar FliJ family protein n=1 Tax=Helicobacter sp. TaxID=218 RepID=UPI0025BB5CA3|nr:flagellar FliJ family protein [Helicobacter sp.]MBR2494537.1 flagellar FliJ family protein [Helicobacter sp.]
MIAQFDKLIKAQEQKLSLCEQHIVRYNNDIAAKQSQVNGLISQIAQMSLPKAGDFSVLLQANAKKRAFVFEIDSLQEQIAKDKARIQELEREYRLLCIEFEKLKHIREIERENLIKTLKQKERRELDEVAILLHRKELL